MMINKSISQTPRNVHSHSDGHQAHFEDFLRLACVNPAGAAEVFDKAFPEFGKIAYVGSRDDYHFFSSACRRTACTVNTVSKRLTILSLPRTPGETWQVLTKQGAAK